MQKVRTGKFSKPWMSNGLLTLIKTKHKLYKKYLKKSSHTNIKLYSDFKNKLNHSIRIAKRLYFETKLKSATSDILNEVINRKKYKSKLSSVFYSNNRDISDPIVIANRFCDYFTNIVPNLAKQIPVSVTTAGSYLRGNFPNSLFFHYASELEIIEIVKTLRSTSAAGHDKITVWIVKSTIDLISEPICNFVNSSIKNGLHCS